MRTKGAADVAGIGCIRAGIRRRAGGAPGVGGALMLPGAPHVAYREGELFIEGCALRALAAEHGTPLYVYSRTGMLEAVASYQRALIGRDHLVCYAMKANSSLAVLQTFAAAGCGFDIVSSGELDRVLAVGVDASRIVFSGVGKTRAEMRQALDAGVMCFNVESDGELDVLSQVASQAGRTAKVSLRVNPDVDAGTHPYISTGLKESKFGVAFADAPALYRHAATLPGIAVHGIDIHIGSQITELEPYREATRKILDLVDVLGAAGIPLAHVDVGGGLGIRYRDERPVPLPDYAAMLTGLFRGRRERMVFEPGRRLVGDAGILLTRVLYLKDGTPKRFAIVDAAMNDLLRPSLYGAWHAVDAVRPRAGAPLAWDIVGPVCESGDFLALDRPLVLAEGDLLAVRAAGAYAMAMSSNYNARPRAAEVIVDGETMHLARRRERVDELFAAELRLP